MLIVRTMSVVLNFSHRSMRIFIVLPFITARRCSEKENEYAEYEPKILHGTKVQYKLIGNKGLTFIFLQMESQMATEQKLIALTDKKLLYTNWPILKLRFYSVFHSIRL